MDQSAKAAKAGPEVKKTFFMLNSAKHEICRTNKSQMTHNCKFFLVKYS